MRGWREEKSDLSQITPLPSSPMASRLEKYFGIFFPWDLSRVSCGRCTFVLSLIQFKKQCNTFPLGSVDDILYIQRSLTSMGNFALRFLLFIISRISEMGLDACPLKPPFGTELSRNHVFF